MSSENDKHGHLSYCETRITMLHKHSRVTHIYEGHNTKATLRACAVNMFTYVSRFRQTTYTRWHRHDMQASGNRFTTDIADTSDTTDNKKKMVHRYNMCNRHNRQQTQQVTDNRHTTGTQQTRIPAPHVHLAYSLRVYDLRELCNRKWSLALCRDEHKCDKYYS